MKKQQYLLIVAGIGLLLFVYFFNKSQIKDPCSKIWISSIDSLRKNNPPQIINALFNLSKNLEEINVMDIQCRKLCYPICNFSIGLFLDKNESPIQHYAEYDPKINVIHIYACNNSFFYGDSTKWISRVILLSHELVHATMPEVLSGRHIKNEANEWLASEMERKLVNFIYPQLEDSLKFIGKSYVFKSAQGDEMFKFYFGAKYSCEGRFLVENLRGIYVLSERSE